ncbi:MAG: FAD-dependent monooxygenase [Woeseiaceae bacterium]|nr:FAD-dependent monooxygenase [Woeseiaceae bacterium]
MVEPAQVLIVGAGPVGLTTALALSRAGIAVRIVDADETIDRRMRASMVHPPTLDMLDDLGVAVSLVRMGRKVQRWQIRQHESGESVTFDLAAIADATQHPYRLQVEQRHLGSLLIDALAEHGVHIEFRTRVESLMQDSDVVTLRTSDGQSIQSHWVIGADGTDSAVRASARITFDGDTNEHGTILVATDFPFHEHLPDLTDVAYCWSNRGPFTLLRLKNYWRVSLHAPVAELDTCAEEENIREWLGFIHEDARNAKITGIAPYVVRERCVKRFRAGRVLLAGNAAHVNPPSGGMGMNAGIHDAVNLASKLTEVMNGASTDLLLQYDRQRRHAIANRVLPQAVANRARMAEQNRGTHARRLARYRAIAADPEICRQFLLAGSMITSLEEARAIE